MLSCGVALCHAEGAQERPATLGVVIDHIDPNVSLVGSVVAGQMVADEDGRQGTAVRIHPKAMYALFDETVTFCGDESARVSRADGTLISGNYAFTYRRAAARLIKGVPCFELRSVDKLEAK
jgi:hypothetical protein